MEHSPYTVTWNIGNFGHLLQGILQIEEFGLDIPSEGTTSHDIGILGHINIVHPYNKSKLINKSIKPYFADKNLKFLPLYLNYIKNNFQVKKEQFVKTYWNHTEQKCPVSFNINMTNFLLDTTEFYNDIKEFVGKQELSHKTIKFIEDKKQNNLPLFARYIEVTKTEDLSELDELEQAIKICYDADGDYNKVKAYV